VTMGDMVGSAFTQHARQKNLLCGLSMINPSRHTPV
jgi:hypothetical protein